MYTIKNILLQSKQSNTTILKISTNDAFCSQRQDFQFYLKHLIGTKFPVSEKYLGKFAEIREDATSLLIAKEALL